jgi:hypothetical protein
MHNTQTYHSEKENLNSSRVEDTNQATLYQNLASNIKRQNHKMTPKRVGTTIQYNSVQTGWTRVQLFYQHITRTNLFRIVRTFKVEKGGS